MTPKEIIQKVEKGEITKERAKELLLGLKTPSKTSGGTLNDVIEYVCQVLVDTLKFKKEHLDLDTEFENFGVESVQSINLINLFEKKFGSLSKTLLYEYKTIRELAQHFFDNYADQFAKEQQAPASPQLHIQPSVVESSQPLITKEESVSLPKNVSSTPKVEEKSDPIPAQDQDIAIVGLYGRYPKIEGQEDFWECLENRKSVISEIPKERFDYAKLYAPDSNASLKMTTKWGGFVDGIEEFDASLFKIMPIEAKRIDPQERLFLQAVWAVLEDAGYSKEALLEVTGKQVGVFVGASYDEYPLLAAYSTSHQDLESATGNLASIANRASYFFDFQGPSQAVNTMCSSSLVALNNALLSLRSGECNCAIVGGVNVNIHPNKYLILSRVGMLSKEGRAQSFEKGGDGFVPSDGVGAIMLKPLKAALEDKDHIYGVVKGCGVNSNGRTNGYRSPSGSQQAQLIETVLKKANIEQESITYIEGQGSGSELGDRVELEALGKVFIGRDNRCAIGSVKSNLGHCEAASSMAGLTKILLQMEKRRLAPSFASQDRYLDVNSTSFYFPEDQEEWKGVNDRLRAGICSFGAGGTNAFAVIENYSNSYTTSSMKKYQIPLSAATKPQLLTSIKRLKNFLKNFQGNRDGIELLRGWFAEILAVDKNAIGTNLYFNDLGIGFEEEFQLIKKIKEHLQKEIDIVDLRACQTIESLASFLNMGFVKEGAVSMGSIAYTLCHGREQMKERVLFEASTIEELCQSLDAYIENRSHPLVLTGESQAVNSWDGSERRMSLPTYPFAKDRHWILDEKLLPMQYGSIEDAADESVPFMLSQVDWLETKSPKKFESDSENLLISSDAVGSELERLFSSGKLGQRVALSYGSGYQHLQENFSVLLENVQQSMKKGGANIIVLCDSQELPYMRFAYGMFKVVEMEQPKVRGKVLAIDDLYQMIPSQVEAIVSSEFQTEATCVKITSETRLELVPMVYPHSEILKTQPLFRENSTYIISGGLGGIIQSIFRNIDPLPTGTRIVLTGRSPIKNDTIESLQKRHSRAQFDYLQCDVTKSQEVQTLVEKIAEDKRPIRGVIHAAGVLRDRLAINKKVDEAYPVLETKVAGLLNLDRYTKDKILDYFISFSSEAGLFGNVGQVDYASANAYVDGFMSRRLNMVSEGLRNGRSLSIDWPYWEDGGMTLPPHLVAEIKQEYGIYPLSTSNAIEAMVLALNTQAQQIFVSEGELDLIKLSLGIQEAIPYQKEDNKTESYPIVQLDGEAGDIATILGKHLAKLTELKLEDIRSSAQFLDMGIDSITLSTFGEVISKEFDIQLDVNDFYHYPDLHALANRIYDLKDQTSLNDADEKSIDEMTTDEVVKELLEKV